MPRKVTGIQLVRKNNSSLSTIEELYVQDFKTQDYTRELFFQLSRDMKTTKKYDNFIKEIKNKDPTFDFIKVKNSYRNAFNFNPNGQKHEYQTYVFLPKIIGTGNVVKIYHCEDTEISKYNVLREICMQKYAYSICSDIKVPKIINYGRIEMKSTDSDTPKIFYVIEMEFIPYKNLKDFLLQFIHTEKQLNTKGIFDNIIKKINDSMDCLEQKNFYHNDLHYENIMVGGTLDEPIISFIDYGRASSNNDMQQDFKLTTDKIKKILIKDLKSSHKNNSHHSSLGSTFSSIVSNHSSLGSTINSGLSHPLSIGSNLSSISKHSLHTVSVKSFNSSKHPSFNSKKRTRNFSKENSFKSKTPRTSRSSQRNRRS